ncbi:MAG TPA: aldo/keto reductase [Sedimentisphaerales bacterium]|nr:aldo/keto reductase [Sedimentisphaerales bacterium]
MKQKERRIDRRDFLRTVSAAGLGSILASAEAIAAGPNEPDTSEKTDQKQYPQVPKRRLGKLTWIADSGNKVPLEVPCLALGMMFDAVEQQIVLRKAIQFGVTYWDTAYSYSGGNSELGIGKFLSRDPHVRKELFIVSKASQATTVEDVEKRLQESMKRMQTDYIDLYYGVHQLKSPGQLTDDLKKWAQNAKNRKLIRFFGVSTHENMAQCLTAAARLDWIDAIMVKYNFREMQDPQMHDAIDACYKAGIGLTAMKTQARGQALETEADKKLTDHFIERGFTAGQAKLKVVLDDKRISSVAVGRGNLSELSLNVAVALDKTKLASDDMKVFKQVAQETCTGYCAGCANICGSALPEMPYVGDVMRCLMYYNSYGETETAKELFATIPHKVRNKLLTADYSLAEARCPQRMPIARLMAEAAEKLA